MSIKRLRKKACWQCYYTNTAINNKFLITGILGLSDFNRARDFTTSSCFKPVARDPRLGWDMIFFIHNTFIHIIFRFNCVHKFRESC